MGATERCPAKAMRSQPLPAQESAGSQQQAPCRGSVRRPKRGRAPPAQPPCGPRPWWAGGGGAAAPGEARRGEGSGRSAAERPRWALRARRRSGGGRGGGGGSCCGGSCARWPRWPCFWPAARPGAAVSAGPRRGAVVGPAEPRLRRAAPRGPPGPGCCAPGAAPGAARNLAELGVRRGGAGPARPGDPGGHGAEGGPEPSCGAAAPRWCPPACGGPLPAALRLRRGRSEAVRVVALRSRERKQNLGEAYLPLRKEDRTPP